MAGMKVLVTVWRGKGERAEVPPPFEELRA